MRRPCPIAPRRSGSASLHRTTWREVFDERAPLIGAPAFFGPLVVYLLGPWLLVLPVLVGPFALILTVLLVLAVAAGLLVVFVAVIASPYLVVRHLHAHDMVRVTPHEAAAGVGHRVALSVVGTDRLQERGYFRAKLAQEELIQSSSIPYSIVHATQFFEFMSGIADAGTDGNLVRLPPVLIQPMAADDVATALARVAVDPPVNGIVEIAGPDQFQLDELIRDVLKARSDPREVIA